MKLKEVLLISTTNAHVDACALYYTLTFDLSLDVIPARPFCGGSPMSSMGRPAFGCCSSDSML